jgi:hypothetical protein
LKILQKPRKWKKEKTDSEKERKKDGSILVLDDSVMVSNAFQRITWSAFQISSARSTLDSFKGAF